MTIHWPRTLPMALVLFRGLLGPVALLVAWLGIDSTGMLLSILVVVGLLSDVFDGVLARRLGVSSDQLRIWDSRADVVFFVLLVAALAVRSPSLWVPLGVFFVGIAVLELAVHLISLLRFRRQSSTHHYLSKAFSILLFALLVQLFLYPVVTWYFWVVCGVGLASFLEAALIMLTLDHWQCDVRTVFDVRGGVVVREKQPSRS